MSNKKKSGYVTTRLASQKLRDPQASKIQKTLAGSVLAQAANGKVTSSEVEDIAARALSSPKFSQDTKSLAGSIVSQSDPKR